jgi:hypothetical protein
MGSPFASQTTSDRIPLPFDPPNWVQVRKLTGRELERAAESHRDGLAADRPRLWPDRLRRALQFGATDPDVMQAIADPLLGYDRYALLAGLVAWSYPRSIKRETKTLGEPEIDAVDDLDDEAVEFIATEVLRRTKPHLFHTSEDAEIEKKTADDAASIVGRERAAAV